MEICAEVCEENPSEGSHDIGFARTDGPRQNKMPKQRGEEEPARWTCDSDEGMCRSLSSLIRCVPEQAGTEAT